MRLKKFLLLLAPIALMANTCTPNGYTIHPTITGSAKSMAFVTPAGDGDLTWRVAVIVNEVNSLSGSSHYTTTSDPGPTVPRTFVYRSGNIDVDCGGPGYAGCNYFGETRANNGAIYATGNRMYVTAPNGDSEWFNEVIAHEIGHALGLDHFDSTIKDSSGLTTAERMCGGGDGLAQCTLADVVLHSGSNFYAEGDVRGLQKLAGAAVSTDAFNPIGTLDTVSVSGGNVYVAGWTIDGDDISGNEVHAYIYRLDGSIAASRNLGRAQADRSDIGAAYPWAYSFHGYNALAGTVGGGTYNVCTYGINVGIGGNVQLGCKTVSV